MYAEKEMNIDKYLEGLIVKHEKSNKVLDQEIVEEIKKKILSFEGKKIHHITSYGSFVKRTNIQKKQKAKLLISMKEQDKRSEEEMTIWLYYCLNNTLELKNQRQERQLEFNYKGIDFSVFIAKKKDKTFDYHVLQNQNYKREILTNFNIHTTNVVESNFQNEIILMKLWREKHHLYFPTMYLELVVLEVLRKCDKINLFSRIIQILDFLGNDFIHERFYDPSNTNNIISDYLSQHEKEKIQEMAKLSLMEEDITDMIA